MKKSISNESFFRYKPQKPFISSYLKFINYTERYNINSNEKSKKYAFLIFLNSLPKHFNRPKKNFFL